MAAHVHADRASITVTMILGVREIVIVMIEDVGIGSACKSSCEHCRAKIKSCGGVALGIKWIY